MAEMTWHQAIQQVLRDHGDAMHCAEITDEIIQRGLRQHFGATPQNTVGAHLANSVKHDGNESPYVKTGKATYSLRESLNSALARSAASDAASDGDESGLIQAFGMYWLSDAVHWTPTPKLLGQQQVGAAVVDFNEQRGVYLLHDGREVIYVGRSVDRPLGRRLFEHTKDRLRARWNRFSWFGLLGVTEEGALTEVTYALTPDLIASTLEALLIEGLEPRQNRKRGDDFAAVEYLQAEDPEIERLRMRSLLATMQDKLST